jgi:GMP synthase (glutamine-hydrolysing)
VVGISSDEQPQWEDLMFVARIIPRICHNINRVCYIFGKMIRDPVQDITTTFLTSGIISTIRQVDHVANQVSSLTRQPIGSERLKCNSFQVLIASGFYSKLSQMPVVLIPLHFDRDSINRIPSCQHSVVLRPFITQDFMTGIPATPGKEIPEEVSSNCIH